VSFRSYKYINITKTFHHFVPFASIVCVVLNVILDKNSLLKYLVHSSPMVQFILPVMLEVTSRDVSLSGLLICSLNS